MTLPDSTPDTETQVSPNPEPLGTDEEPQNRHLHAVPETTTDTAETSENAEPEEPASTTLAGRIDRQAITAWAREAFTPNSGLYTDRPPAVGEIVTRAKHGDQVAESGPLRKLSTVHGYLAAGNKIVCRTWEWVFDHTARLGVVAVLLAVAITVPTTRHLIGYLLTPFVWAQQLLLG